MSGDGDLFNRAKALQCFGSEAILSQVLSEFLTQVEPMLQRLRAALQAGNREEVRKAVHWFRGGLSYLFSPAAERACMKLDEQTRQEPLPDVSATLAELESVMRRLQEHVDPSGGAAFGT